MIEKIGYSERIKDPAFVRYLKNTNRWSSVFSLNKVSRSFHIK